MRIRENLGGILASSNKPVSSPTIRPSIGKVYGIVTTENTPTKKQFERVGGFNGIGTVFYLDYDQSKNISGDLSDAFLDKCKIAKPFSDFTQAYPLVGELVQLTIAPSPASQINETSTQKYYTGVVNLWNNNQQNSPSPGTLGKTFTENSDIRRLAPFEGDRIIQGRKGNGLRFGTTVKTHSDTNEWSTVGNDGDPITILVNGYITTDQSSQTNVEEVNKELSSIYLTSTQLIPLLPDRKDALNSLTKPLLPNKYQSSQLIFNSDRITLNSKKDEIMIFAKTNIEINTNNIINLNAGNRVHLNTKKVFLGSKKDGSAPDEPVLLGDKTKLLLTDLIKAISELGNALTSVVSTPPGSPLAGVNVAGGKLSTKMAALQKKLKSISSENTFTS
jgi:hypothetical protein